MAPVPRDRRCAARTATGRHTYVINIIDSVMIVARIVAADARTTDGTAEAAR